MRVPAVAAVPLALALAALPACSKKEAPAPTSRLGAFAAEESAEKSAEGELLHCYLLGRESNAPVRVCGEGSPAPDNNSYLIQAVTPAPSKFTEEGAALAPGWYLLRSAGSNKVDAWSLGRLGAHEWLGGGKALLAVETDAEHVTHVRVIDETQRVSRDFDVPLAKSEGYVNVHADGDAAVLLVQKLGVELLILVHDPLGNTYVETLDVPNSKNAGARRLWLRGNEERNHGGVFKWNAALAGNITWKGQDPFFEGKPLGPFESADDRRKRKPSPSQ